MPLRYGAVDCYVHEFEIGKGYGGGSTVILEDETCPTAEQVFSKTYTALSPDIHTFQVRARTSAGWGPWEQVPVTISRDTPLTATWGNVPRIHDHPAAFTVTLTFSKEVDVTETQLESHAIIGDGISAVNATPTTAGSTKSWSVTLTPESRRSPVTAMVWQVFPWETCDQAHTICADGQKLSADAIATVHAP